MNLLIALVIAAAPPAPPEWPCHPGSVQTGPVELSYESGGLSAARRACPRSEFVLSGNAQAIADTDNFYGNIQASLNLQGSVAIAEGFEVHASLEAVHFRQVIQSIQANYTGLGHTQLGATFVVASDERFVLSAMTRATLPTALDLYQNAYPFGLDAGFLFAFGLNHNVILHGSAIATANSTLGRAPFSRTGLGASFSAEYLPWSWLSFVGTTQGFALYDDPLDHLSIAGAARVKIWDGLSTQLAIAVPFAGRERNLGRGSLDLRWRF